MKPSPEKIVDYSDPFAIHDLLERLDNGRYGSVTKDIESLINRKVQVLNPLLCLFPSLGNELCSKGMSLGEDKHNVIDLNDDDDAVVDDASVRNDSLAKGGMPVVIIDSDDEESNDNGIFDIFKEIQLPKSNTQRLTDILVIFNGTYNYGIWN